jgi:hypothetical protein
MRNPLQDKLKNITNGKKYIDSLLQKYEINDKVEEIDILSLLHYHPTKHINIENIEYLTRKVRPPYNTIALYYKYKNSDIIDDISYIMCIKNLFGKYNKDFSYEEDVKNAFRNESHLGKKKAFFLEHTVKEDDQFFGVCEHCSKKTSKTAVDHYEIPFKQILEDFLAEKEKKLIDVEVFENDTHEMRLRDADLAKQWLEFHDSRVKFRLLCKSCNSHFGSYGV